MKLEWTHVTQPYLVGNFSDTTVKQSVQLITTGADIPVIVHRRLFCCSTNGRRNKCEARNVRMVARRGLLAFIKIRLRIEILDFYAKPSPWRFVSYGNVLSSTWGQHYILFFLYNVLYTVNTQQYISTVIQYIQIRSHTATCFDRKRSSSGQWITY